MTRNETIEKVMDVLEWVWSRNDGGDSSSFYDASDVFRKPWLKEHAEKILALFPDQKYDEEWQVPDENTPVDTLCWCIGCTGEWLLRYFAKPGYCWDNGTTSITAKGRMTRWDYIVLADPCKPSPDYRPKRVK
jgi:hypothetical protein